MSGSARSSVIVNMVSVRVAGTPDYIPSHQVNGKDKPTSQRSLFRVYHNDGTEEGNVFSCTAWGKLADAVARGFAPGKEVSIIGELKSYRAKVWKEVGGGKREPERTSDGGFKTVTKVSIKVERIIFGSDGNATVLDEISKGLRPTHYNVIGSADETTWKNMCRVKNSEQFIAGNAKFGYANVKVPSNAQIIVDAKTGTGAATTTGDEGASNTTATATNTATTTPTTTAAPGERSFTPNNTFPAGNTVDMMLNAGWTFEQMRDSGYGVINEPTPAAPDAPSVRTFTPNNTFPVGNTVDMMLNAGWTFEQMRDSGYGTINKPSVNTPAPPTTTPTPPTTTPTPPSTDNTYIAPTYSGNTATGYAPPTTPATDTEELQY